jgi:hypothetical protein
MGLSYKSSCWEGRSSYSPSIIATGLNHQRFLGLEQSVMPLFSRSVSYWVVC